MIIFMILHPELFGGKRRDAEGKKKVMFRVVGIAGALIMCVAYVAFCRRLYSFTDKIPINNAFDAMAGIPLGILPIVAAVPTFLFFAIFIRMAIDGYFKIGDWID